MNDWEITVTDVDNYRARAVVAGILYLVTHVTSVAAVPLFAAALEQPGFAQGAGSDLGLITGAFLEAVLALGVVGTAVTLYPVVKHWGKSLTLGHVSLRILEGASILAGVAAMLTVTTLRSMIAEGSNVDASGRHVVASLIDAFVGLHDWTFWLGPNFVLPIGTLLIATVLYRSRLVPRWIPIFGLIGGVTLTVSSMCILFGVIDQVSVWGGVAAVPAFIWELGLALWLVFRGFSPRALKGIDDRAMGGGFAR